MYSISSINWPSLKLLLVIDFWYLDDKFSLPKFAKSKNSWKYLFYKFSSGNQIFILYQLTKIEATACNSFWDFL